MRNLKQWLAAAFVVCAVIGTLALVESVSSNRVIGDERGPGDHWRNHAGHWSLWNEADRRWYCTDGRHWFYHDGHEWRLYRFDRSFGRTGFVHGEYVAPHEEVKIVLPRHGIIIR